MEDHQSVERWRRESRLSIERSRERREQGSPHPWPSSLREWLIAFGITAVVGGVGYGFLLLFGTGAWS